MALWQGGLPRALVCDALIVEGEEFYGHKDDPAD